MEKQQLKDIIADQYRFKFKPTDIPRWIQNPDDNSIVVLSGVRRCGKSTLLQELRSLNQQSDFYLNFDDERLFRFTVDDFQILLETFLELFGQQTIFYFDEIQNIHGWERFVRRLHDYGYKVYVTGSNASMLSRELGTHLTGRYLQKEIYPFSFQEYLLLNQKESKIKALLSTEEKASLKAEFNTYFGLGGFPAYLQTKNSQYLKSLYESIIYRDVMVRNGLSNEKEILELVFYIASNPAKLVTYNSMAKSIGVKNATTVKNYLSFLQDSYLIFLINKYDVSIKKQIQNPKKAYFIDVGLIRELGFYHSEDNGRLLENIVFIELKRRAKEVYYHHQNKECDFVIKEKNKIVEAIQVCWSVYDEATRNRELAGLTEAMECYKLTNGLILTESEEQQIELSGFKVEIKPVWKWFLNI